MRKGCAFFLLDRPRQTLRARAPCRQPRPHTTADCYVTLLFVLVESSVRRESAPTTTTTTTTTTATTATTTATTTTRSYLIASSVGVMSPVAMPIAAHKPRLNLQWSILKQRKQMIRFALRLRQFVIARREFLEENKNKMSKHRETLTRSESVR